MKKMLILGMAVLILSLVFVGCGGDDDDSTGGNDIATSSSLTVTGIPTSHNGKWLFAYGSNFTGTASYMAADSANTSGGGNLSGVKITGTSATLKIWRRSNQTLVGFDGTLNYSNFAFIVATKATLTQEEILAIRAYGSTDNGSWEGNDGSVDFSSGTGSATWGPLPF
ncbi:MAG: hypothetical protein FWC03_09320 [Treponema sp.]|nr:hypothetical protein [Treponema sp.]